MSKISILVCENYKAEAQIIAKEFEGVEVFAYKAKCTYPNATQNFEPFLKNSIKVAIVGACNLNIDEIDKNIEIHKLENCFHMLAPKSLIDNYMQNGAYIITSGWLSRWREIITNLEI